jgi:N-acetylmuramoyl-L-alanine amidase CwlA
MSYTLQEQYSSKNQVPGSQADSVWHRGARKVSSITIHHWGNKGQQFGIVRDFLCTNNSPTSAHYVVQDGLVACIVSPDDCAFHAGNAEGNSHSIGIECRPEATDGDYATIAELIRDLRAIYGDIPLRPHNYWYNTACPGDYDLARLDSLARGTSTISVQSASIQEEDMPSAQEIAAAVWGFSNKDLDQRDMRQIVADIPVAVWSYANPNIGGGDAYQILRDAVANTDRIAGAVASVAAQRASEGATVEQITEAVKQAISESVVKVDVSVDGGK